jgi:hypothetical protein
MDSKIEIRRGALFAQESNLESGEERFVYGKLIARISGANYASMLY